MVRQTSAALEWRWGWGDWDRWGGMRGVGLLCLLVWPVVVSQTPLRRDARVRYVYSDPGGPLAAWP